MKNSENILINIQKDIQDHSKKYTIESISFIFLGILALILPQVIAVSFNIIFAIILILGGVIKSIAISRTRAHRSYGISSFFGIILGFLMLFNPFAGATALAYILGIYLIFEGSFEIFLATSFWPVFPSYLLFISGVLSLIFSIIIFSSAPSVSVAILGFLLGINFLLFGITGLTTISQFKK